MADIFISYASEDRERVRPLAQALQARKLSVWWDRALAAGDDYSSVIEKALKEAKAVVVVWTHASANSAFVRDEAGRARDQGRLVPVLLDQGVQIPLGFGSFQAEDFTAWNGDARAPQVGLLEEALRARIEGRAVDAAAVQAKRKRTMARIRLVSILGIVATLLGIAASVTILTRDREQATVQQDQLSRLLELVAEGKISGDQALELAKLVQTDAFEDAAASAATSDAEAPALVTPADATAEERAAMAQAPRINRREMMASARQSFENAAATLLQDPDERVRTALLQVRTAETRQAGLDAMWAVAKEGGASSAALWRACGSLMLAVGDPRAAQALENARALNPQDRELWRLLSFAYARQNRPKEAAGAALVGEGIRAAASSNWSEAAVRLDQALPLVDDAQTRGFVLGQLGDAAAATENWEGAEQRYQSALEVHGDEKDIAALALDASKLARAQIKRGEARRACNTLRRARAEGAAVTDAEMEQACAPMRPGMPAPAQPAPAAPAGPAQP
ncbi:MAG: TIR domain-containing protein [Hyphomonadaceae bacterium]|nr:TIR domain-containing protein [Hyphomonadaceae bacterium]